MASVLLQWAADPGYLFSYLAFSSFLNTVDLKKVSNRYREMLSDVPVLKL